MIFYYVLLLFLSWPQLARGTAEDADLKGEEFFDQIATASENVAHAAGHPNADSNNLEEQLPSAPSAVDASVHYENSNGFVPMIPSASPDDPVSSPLQADESEQQDPNESEESSAAIAEDRLNEFELLKVNNDTPAVANYQEFYENVRSTVNTVADSEPDDASPSGRTSDGKRTESYAHNYVWQPQQVGEEDAYAQFYSYNNVQDMKKTTYEQEKVAGNYHPQDTANHNTGQNAALPSSSRTNYEVNELANSGTHDNVAEQSRARHRFSRPVVVTESNDQKADFGYQVGTSVPDNDQRTSRNLEFSTSDESGEYSAEYIERPRIGIQKRRRRPAYPDTSRKLPKEHRGTEESAEEDKQKYNPAKLKSQRYKMKTNPWINDPSANHQDESIEDIKYTDVKSTKTHGSKSKHNTWNQISPNLEISHSNGIELDQAGKPKYVVNLVPVTSFDHATALGNSQGFDVSNAMLQNIVTVAPILSTPQSVLAPGLTVSKNLMSTPLPTDIIVGQNSFQSPVQTVLVTGGQNGKDTLRATYLPSTPVFAVTSSSLNPTLQNVRLQNNAVAPRTAFGTPAPTSVVQQMPAIGPGVQQLLVPQPTVQTYSNFLQTPLQTNSQYQIQVNPHGLQGQNLISHGNLQVQGLSTAPTTLLTSSPTMPESRINVVSADSQNKKSAYAGANILTTASMSVGQNDGQKLNGNSYHLPNHNAKDVDAPRTKTYVQATQVMPTLLQIPAQHEDAKQYLKLHSSSMDDAVQHLQAQINKQFVKNAKLAGVTLQSTDSAGSHSNNIDTVNALAMSSGNAHLPNIVAKNVEIVNPNIKPSPIDTTLSAYYPTAVLTTPIPIFSTISSVTQPVALQNYVNSLTENGAKAKHLGTVELKTSQNQERPMFNPINFVPNIDILKNQNALNNKPSTNELLQQGLSLVPVMPGGNFFRPSLAAQSELVAKPKLTSDLQKYAEEMFKESLKTMYNSQKWNNDRRPNNQNGSESDIAKLRLELQKLRASLSGDSRFRDILEAHPSEDNVRATDSPKSSSDKKKDPLLATLEHLLKTKPRGPIHIFHGVTHGRPGRKRKPGEPNFNSDFHDDFPSDIHAMEFLTPPRNHFHSKGPYHEKPKKRPSRYKNGPRKPIRPSNSPPRINGVLDASASTINIHLPDDDPPYNKMPFEHDSLDLDSRPQPSFDTYPTFTTSSPETIGSILRELKTSGNRNKNYDINHPRTHNLLGLLMKNKQLPTRSARNYFRNKDQLRQYFESERQRLQQQYYEDALRDNMRDYLERSDVTARPGLVVNRSININGTA